jgi:hypothetical protein
MTPAEQKAWISGRDAAALVCLRKRDVPIDEGSPFERGIYAGYNGAAIAIRALTPPAATPSSMPPLAEVITHYGIDALCRALAPEIVREAGEQAATAWTPPPESERRDGYECLATVTVVWDQVSGVWRTETGYWFGHAYSAAFAPLPEGKP